MDVFTVITVLFVISALISYLNVKVVRLPDAIGVVTISVVISVIILVLGKSTATISAPVTELVQNVNFSETVLNIFLGILLFAAALQFDYKKLKEERISVFILSTLAVFVTTAVFGTLLFFISKLIDFELPFVVCLLFGSIISPTDPIVVEALLKKTRLPERLRILISGESLFNDGVGIILFVVLLIISFNGGKPLPFSDIVGIFALEVIGGIAVGYVAGFFGGLLLKTTTDFKTVFLITTSVVLVLSEIAHAIHGSVPLAAVTAGLMIGNANYRNPHLRLYLTRMWQFLDSIFNTLLFVLIGLQLVEMPFLANYWTIGLISIILILIARFVSITLPAYVLLHKRNFANLFILTWAGLRGAISIALALLLPESPYREVILSGCYMIVIFSIIVQGLTLNKVVEKLVGK